MQFHKKLMNFELHRCQTIVFFYGPIGLQKLFHAQGNRQPDQFKTLTRKTIY